ncbi:hypothetical protein PF005_g1302 [Phytophthora fragariae]|uniref:Uncharacterized protein n=2 Tax=Phytophthora TaxID=4783 RepID=A0A6A3ZFL4_9STRA|nr:hypothetical protein PF003_g4187 [Phytophthora fragariae]KAE9048038.1 hypothetical protein PR002_g691 [Phytophthora rubi]KAE8949110.1 hypothetical protein PF009_g1324 [Phytophthora fragariae]KAE9030041.1 hypothetical protein PF011_g796 [Phytophthora fragariae]KAE9052124.1 hypothetical protein PR001_g803 [Phytophthora rubi]
MLKRYFRLLDHLSADGEDLADYLPSRTTHRKLAGILDSLATQSLSPSASKLMG